MDSKELIVLREYNKHTLARSLQSGHALTTVKFGFLKKKKKKKIIISLESDNRPKICFQCCEEKHCNEISLYFLFFYDINLFTNSDNADLLNEGVT